MYKILLVTSVLLSSIAQANTTQDDLTFGLEMGLDNFFIAPTARYSLNDNIRLSASAGLFLVEGSGSLYYDAGVLYYPYGQGFRTSLSYGTHSIYKKNNTTGSKIVFSSSSSESATTDYSFPTFEGISLGLGWDWSDSNGGWQMDMMYILTSSADNSSELEDSFTEKSIPDATYSTTTSKSSSANAQGPDGSGSFWLKLGYQF